MHSASAALRNRDPSSSGSTWEEQSGEEEVRRDVLLKGLQTPIEARSGTKNPRRLWHSMSVQWPKHSSTAKRSQRVQGCEQGKCDTQLGMHATPPLLSQARPCKARP